MLKLSQFNELTELPALGPANRLFSAKTSDQQQVFIQQLANASGPDEQSSRVKTATHSWLAETKAVFDEGGFHYRVIPAQHYTVSFFEVMAAVQQHQLAVFPVIQSLLRLLEDIHQAGYILGELKAETLYWSAAGDDVCLLESRFASTVSRVHPLQVKNELDLAMLRTLAPEATGRVNCPLDQRADLYALGVLCYALAAGRFPFEQQQPLALIHAHIAKKPPALSDVTPAIDPRLAIIITTLLNKDPNHRYHSIKGVVRDVDYCAQHPDATDTAAFSPSVLLGIQQLPFADTLYERADILQLLESTLAKAYHGGPVQVVAVQGYSGSGKTSVIAQLHPATLNDHTFFIQGKHDQYLQNSVFTGLKSALQQLAEAILQQPDMPNIHCGLPWRPLPTARPSYKTFRLTLYPNKPSCSCWLIPCNAQIPRYSRWQIC